MSKPKLSLVENESPPGLKQFLNKFPDAIEISDDFNLVWSRKDIGYGRVNFFMDNETGKIYCKNGPMSKTFIKTLLSQMVDECILTGDRNDKTKKTNERKMEIFQLS